MDKRNIEFLVKCGYMRWWEGGYHLTRKGQKVYGNVIDRELKLAQDLKKSGSVGQRSHEKTKGV